MYMSRVDPDCAFFKTRNLGNFKEREYKLGIGSQKGT